ncbi:MAG TPA: energy transducer TonB [Mucilaginibacter sp.]
MKRFLLVFITTIISFSLQAQKTDTAKYADDDKIYTDPVEVMPEFTGGMRRLYARLENIDYLFLDRMNGRMGETILILIIEKDGGISNIRVVHGLSREQDNEIIKVVKKLKKWKPGMQGGKPVRVQYAIPINFKLLN